MKTIVYLDQNYVSHLTKARLGVKVYPDVAAYMAHLYRQGRYWAMAAPGETPLIFPDPRAPGPKLVA